MNQLLNGQKIQIPSPFVRSVSFEKIREDSMSQRNHPTHVSNQKSSKPTDKSNCQGNAAIKRNPCQFYEKILAKKLTDKDKTKSQLKTDQNEHMQQLKRELEEKQMQECTFQPVTNNSQGVNCRSLDQFLSHQAAYEQHKSDKVKEMRDIIQAQIEKENTFKPKTITVKASSRNTNDSQGNRSGFESDVHDRLYRQRSEKENTPISKSITSKSSKSKGIFEVSAHRNQKQCQFQTTPNSSSELNSRKQTTVLSSQNSMTLQKQEYPSKEMFANQTEKSSELNLRGTSKNSIRTDSQSSRSRNQSQKGLKTTKHMNVQEVCSRKLGRLNNPKSQLDDQAQRKRNRKNLQIFINKILREISHILDDANLITTQSHFTNLGYLDLCLILEKMNFIQESDDIENRKFVSEIWQVLQGDVYDSVPLFNLIKIILCLLGCHDLAVIEGCLQNFMSSLPKHSNPVRILVISDTDSKRIKSNFEELALNRLKKGEYVSAHRPSESQQCTFKPFVSKNSTQMAQKYRQKIIQDSQQLLNNNLIEYSVNQNGIVQHVDLLMLDQKRKQLKIKMKRQQHEKQQRRIEDQIMQVADQSKKCRLMEKNSNKIEETNKANKKNMGHLRTDDLYEMGKWSLREKKKIEEKQNLPEECTFQPNSNRDRQGSGTSRHAVTLKSQTNSISDCGVEKSDASNRHTVEAIKDYDKSIFRMHQARKMRQQQPQPKTVRCYQKSKNSEDMSPMAYLNVNMDGYEEVKVPVFDTDSMKTITQKVGIFMGIPEKDQQKLQQILELQIMPALNELGCCP